MPVFSSLAAAIYYVADTVLSLYFWVVLAGVILSWVNPDPHNPIVRGIRALTEPVFYRIRRWMPFIYTSGIDFSPFVVILGIKFIQIFLARLLAQML